MKTIEKLKAMKPKFNLIPVILMVSVLFFSSCNDDDDMIEYGEKNVIEVALAA